MKRFAFSAIGLALQTPAWGHHSPVHFDVIHTDAGSTPGVALLTFLVLVAVGIVRAVTRHRNAPRPPRGGRSPRGSRNLGATLRFLEKDR